jgi:putative FmdB family regulatory protein
MPTYEYICEKCGHEFEAFQSISAGPLRICPKDLCGRKKWGRGRVKRRISTGGGLLFKGSGFYITDYRSEGYKQAAKKDSIPPAPAGGESKPTKGETPSPPAKPPPKADKK